MLRHLRSLEIQSDKSSLAAISRTIAVSIIAMILVSCASDVGNRENRQTKRVRSTDTFDSLDTKDIQSLLFNAERSEPARANELRLLAVETALLNTSDGVQAKKIMQLVSAEFPPALQKKYLLAQTKIALIDGDTRVALALLNNARMLSAPLTKSHQLAVGQLRAEAYFKARSYLASARERIFFNSLLEQPQRLENQEQIFSTLLEIPTRSLAAQAEKAITSDLRGWLALATMTKQFQDDPIQQYQALTNWEKVWGRHPAALELPSSLKILVQIISEQAKSIALLLPTDGALGPFGRAIRDGIIASHYNIKSKTVIRVYDTSNGDVLKLLSESVNEGAELVIGPLDRDLVNTLALQTQLPVPVLALNRSTEPAQNSDLYQFGLAPEDEMIQVAEQSFSDGNRKALAIFPDSDWGIRNYETFKTRWTELGGTIVDSTSYSSQKSYSDLVKSLLNVDESEDRSSELRRIIGKRFEFAPRRRQDIDFIFLLGDPAQARGINPTLAFFYAEDIPVYSTSQVHELDDSKIDSIDLNGIRFCDIPWKVTDGDLIKASVQSAWPLSQAKMAPFFALGVDAYRLYPRLQQLKQVTTDKLFGSTGVLQLEENNIITRKLMWAQYRNGEVVTMPLIFDAS
jgi:outer membrane PBP1 activator LpoA protein